MAERVQVSLTSVSTAGGPRKGHVQSSRGNASWFQVSAAILLLAIPAGAREEIVASPDGRLSMTVSDVGSLHYRLSVDGKPVVQDSQLGLEFKDGTSLGPAALVSGASRRSYQGSWENDFGKRRWVEDRYRELILSLEEQSVPRRSFRLLIRAYNDGVAFRYDLPAASGLGNFVLTAEKTEFHFADDYSAWVGGESSSSETQYTARKLSEVPAVTGDSRRKGQPYRGVLPALVRAPGCYVAIAESDLLNWAGMFIQGNGPANLRVNLASRNDGNGAVVSAVPCLSPWRVLMVAHTAAELANSDLIANLATPSRLADTSWVKPGISAWDAWWTGVNPSLPQFTGLSARGDTRSHKEYIDFAAETGWPYQLVDWYWYKDDPTQPLPHVDMPELFAYAKAHNVRLFVWMHSRDLTRVGFEKVFTTMQDWGAAGVKVDFMDSDSQETVQWYAAVLECAARHHLMVDFHGAYKPTGLARTYPNYITQEGVLGNEYNKLPGNQCSPLHTATLPFTRGLLGPMDFTPGGFLNRTPADFRITFPAQVMGTRARQLAMPVIYQSPLLVLCDSPANYRNQPGIEFYRALPTVWDETVVLNGEVGQSIAIARRSGQRWYLAAMNGENAQSLALPLQFLGKGSWTMHSFADKPEGAATDVVEAVGEVNRKSSLNVSLAPAGGFAAVLSPRK